MSAIAENELIEFLLPLNPRKRTEELKDPYMQEGHRIHEVIERRGATTAGEINRETDISIARIIDHFQWALAQDPPKIKLTVLKI
jgi:hypothetical protein